MSTIHSFPPIADASSRRLILGSMPGTASLQAQQYYAHPRNAFWPIMGTLCGFSATLPYDARVQHMLTAEIAIWDVLQCCTRHQSLDSAIVPDSMVMNDFQAFFLAHPQIEQVYFNGQKAATLYRRFVVPSLSGSVAVLPQMTLPSTSPAHASINLAAKLATWSHLLKLRA